MRPTDTHAELRTMVRALQIIVAGILLGLMALLAVGGWRHHFGPIAHAVPGAASFLTWVAVALGLTQPLIFAVIRAVLRRQALQAFDSNDVGPFRQKYMAATIVGAAGIEFGGLMAGLAYLLEGRAVALGVGAGCACALLASIPTRRSVDNLIQGSP